MSRPEYPADIRGAKVFLRDFRPDDVDAILEIAGETE